MRGEGALQRTPGNALTEIWFARDACEVYRYVLSTEPFRAFESIIFVFRKDSTSFPDALFSRSCKAKSTGLNWNKMNMSSVKVYEDIHLDRSRKPNRPEYDRVSLWTFSRGPQSLKNKVVPSIVPVVFALPFTFRPGTFSFMRFCRLYADSINMPSSHSEPNQRKNLIAENRKKKGFDA